MATENSMHGTGLFSYSDVFTDEPNPMSKEERNQKMSEMMSNIAAISKREKLSYDVSDASEILDLVISL